MRVETAHPTVNKHLTPNRLLPSWESRWCHVPSRCTHFANSYPMLFIWIIALESINDSNRRVIARSSFEFHPVVGQAQEKEQQ